MLKVCNIEQTAPCGFAKLHSSFSVKRGRCRASFSPQGLRQGCSGGAACSSLRGALSRTASFPKRTRSRMRITLSTWLRGRARVYSGVRIVFSFLLLAAALAGWAGGKIGGDDKFGTGADILLGITGAFVVRWSLEKIGISLPDVYLLLLSISGAAAFPVAGALGIRRLKRSKARSRLQGD